MQDEQQNQTQEQGMEEGPPETATEEGEKEPEKQHDAVSPGGTCWCGWAFGNIEPHIVSFGAMRNEPVPPIEPPKPVEKASDPNACQPVALNGGKCPKCGWSADDPATRANTHPVLL